MDARRDKSGDMRHIHEEKRVHGLGGFGDALEIDDPGIRAGARHDHFGLVLVSELLDFVVVNLFGVAADVIFDKLVHAA